MVERPFSFINNVCDNYFPHGNPSLIPGEYTEKPLCHVKYWLDRLTLQMSEMSQYRRCLFSSLKLPINPGRNFLQKTKQNISIELNCFHSRAEILNIIYQKKNRMFGIVPNFYVSIQLKVAATIKVCVGNLSRRNFYF